MKIFIYCQHVWGVGHLFRIREICRALKGHDIVLVTGGPEVSVPLPAHVRVFRLPVLQMDAHGQLHGENGRTAKEVWPERIERLFNLFRSEVPDVLLVELYPLGRSAFRRELDPILSAVREGDLPRCRVGCSVRDILVEKRDPEAYEKRVVGTLNRWFDALLVHADPALVELDDTFSRVAEIEIPVIYTGFVAPPSGQPGNRESFRRAAGVTAEERLVVVSAGGGKSGYPLLAAALAAGRVLAARRRVKVIMFTGPFLDDHQRRGLETEAGPGVSVYRFASDFDAGLASADLSISMAGYNTCMNLLVTQVPALVWPFAGDREQPLRAHRLAAEGLVTVLRDQDLQPERLAEGMQAQLSIPAPPACRVNLSGAAYTAQWITETFPVGKRLR